MREKLNKELTHIPEGEKKTYEHPAMEEHNVLDKASDCSYYNRSYNSDSNTYYH